MATHKEKKAKVINGLEASFARSTVGVLTDYRGLTTAETTALRRKLRDSNSELKVVKNTLARFAATRAGKDEVAKSFEGPIAVALGYGDVSAPIKVLTSHIRETKSTLTIKGGFLGNRLLTLEQVMSLATLPSREVLIARVLGQMKSPISSLVFVLNAPLRGIAGVLQARINQLEGEKNGGK